MIHFAFELEITAALPVTGDTFGKMGQGLALLLGISELMLLLQTYIKA